MNTGYWILDIEYSYQAIGSILALKCINCENLIPSEHSSIKLSNIYIQVGS